MSMQDLNVRISCTNITTSQRTFGAKLTSYQRRCDVIDVNTTSFLRHVPTGMDPRETMALSVAVVGALNPLCKGITWMCSF